MVTRKKITIKYLYAYNVKKNRKFEPRSFKKGTQQDTE